MRSWFWSLLEHLPLRVRLVVLRILLRRQPGWPDAFTHKLISVVVDRPDSRFPVIADKFRAREYIAALVGEQYLPALLGAYERAESIPIDHLPRRFVVKANHASGWNYLVRDRALLDRDDLTKQARRWLSTRYGSATEWWYNAMPRRIVVEEFLEGDDGDVPADYKLFTFNGRVRLVQVDHGRFTEHVRNYYDGEWMPVLTHGQFPIGPVISKPSFFAEMCWVAERLAGDFAFVRVDLYRAGGRIFVGELTLLPAGGRDVVTTPKVDQWLGRWFDHAVSGADAPPPYAPEPGLER